MRSYLLRIECFDGAIYNVDADYKEFNEGLNSADKFLAIRTTKGESITLNKTTIKRIDKENMLWTLIDEQGNRSTKLNVNGELIDIQDRTLSLTD